MKAIKKNWLILLVLPFAIYISVKTFTRDNCYNYFYSYNKKRTEIGLKPIDSTWKEYKGTETYHSWVNEEKTIPRYYAKYIRCNNWIHSITKEYDGYLVKVDTTTRIISIQYDYWTEEFLYELEEYNSPKKGKFGKLIKVLSKDEVRDILNKNGIKY